MPVNRIVQVPTVPELLPAITAHFGTPRAFRSDAPPDGPGAYVWDAPGDEGVVYIGSAKSLLKRLCKEQEWIASHDPATMWQVSVIHMLTLCQARAVWIDTSHPPQGAYPGEPPDRVAPRPGRVAQQLAGWNVKRGTRRRLARRWAQQLWERQP